MKKKLKISLVISIFLGYACAAMEIAPEGQTEEQKLYAQLVDNTRTFSKQHLRSISGLPDLSDARPFPGIRSIVDFSTKEQQESIAKFAKETRILITPDTVCLIEKFLTFKRQEGSDIEKLFYASMRPEQFIVRLFEKRPLVFVGYAFPSYTADRAILRANENEYYEEDDFHRIGKDGEKTLSIEEYLSYNEMEIAALLGISSPTFFINHGGRACSTDFGDPNDYVQQGILMGLVGPRYEKFGQMEWRYGIVSEKENTEENGFGLRNSELKNEKKTGCRGMVKLFSDFYGIDFATYDQAKTSHEKGDKRFVKFQKVIKRDKSAQPESLILYHDTLFEKKRFQVLIENTTSEACFRAQASGKKVELRVAGCGLGVWAIDKKRQTKIFLKSFKKYLQKFPHVLDHIDTIDFMYFIDPDGFDLDTTFVYQQVGPGNFAIGKKLIDIEGRKVNILFSVNNVASPISNNGNLLVAMFPWDAGAYVGNEMWKGNFSQSTEPSNVACSLAPTLQNPLINPCFAENVKESYEYAKKLKIKRDEAVKIVEDDPYLTNLIIGRFGWQKSKMKLREVQRDLACAKKELNKEKEKNTTLEREKNDLQQKHEEKVSALQQDNVTRFTNMETIYKQRLSNYNKFFVLVVLGLGVYWSIMSGKLGLVLKSFKVT